VVGTSQRSFLFPPREGMFLQKEGKSKGSDTREGTGTFGRREKRLTNSVKIYKKQKKDLCGTTAVKDCEILGVEKACRT